MPEGLIALLLWWYLHHHGGQASGDPHITTIDGLHYDLQSAGEFVLAQSERYGLEVQGRFVPTSSSSNVSVMSRMAMDVNDHTVEFDSGGMYLDGSPQTLGIGRILVLGGDSYIIHDSQGYLVLPGGMDGAIVGWTGTGVVISVPPSSDSDVIGLLGNADGNPMNDLKLSDGTQLAANASATVLHGDFADSWRVTDQDSLFSYDSGQDTSTFTDLSFPHNITTVHDLTSDQLALATTACDKAGVAAGPDFTSCVLDVALTANTQFATTAAQQVNASVDPNALGVDPQGNLNEDFEGATIPSNLMPNHVATDPATTSFAGPFTGPDTYRLYAQSLPPHVQGTLTFDLLTLGDWTTGTDTKTLTVLTDRGQPYVITPANMTPASTETMADGLPVRRYTVTIPFTQDKSQIEFVVSASGVTGIANQAFGIDNLHLHLDAVPPETFNESLPFTIANGVPASGAGNLETPASEDDYTFNVPDGSGVYVDSQTCPSGTTSLQWQLVGPDASVASSGYNCQSGEVRNLNGGTYTLRVSAQNEAAGTYGLAVTPIPQDVITSTSLDGTPSTITTTAPGQNGSWTFSGAAGEKVYLDFSNGTIGQGNTSVSVLSPDGTTLQQPQPCGVSCSFDATTLPATGTYQVLMNPSGDGVGALTAKVYAIPADATSVITTDGTASTLTTTTPGQNGSWTFNGTAGQRVYFDFSGGTFGNGNAGNDWVAVKKADGTTVAGGQACGSGCGFDTTTLPSTGAYTVVLDPSGDLTGSLTLKAYTVPVDASATISTDGTASTLTTTTPGQNGSWTFSGTAGQKVSFAFSGGTYGNGNAGNDWVGVKNPDGSTLLNGQRCGSGCGFDTTTLPTTGTYTVSLDPSGNLTGSLTAKLTTVIPDAVAAVTTDGTASTLTTTTSGQNGSWTFNGTAGQRVYFDFSAGTFGNGNAGNDWVAVKNPDGSALLNGQGCGSGCGFDTTTLPTTGTYSVSLDPSGSMTGSLTLKAYTVPTDVTATATTGGTASTLTTTTPGQNGSWTFNGTAGQRVYFDFSGGTFGNGNAGNDWVGVKSPDGSTLLSGQGCGSSCGFDTTTLPTTGTYTVSLDPSGSLTGSLNAKFYTVPTDVTATATTGGTASTLTTTTPGQNGSWTFNGTAGQKVNFSFSGGTFGNGNAGNDWVGVKSPDGSTLLSGQGCGSSCGFDTTTLPTTGTYTVSLDPSGSLTGSLTAKLTTVITDAVAAVTTDGTASTLTTTTPGQNGSWTFNGTAGQRVYFDFSGGTFGNGNAGNDWVAVKKADGTTVAGGQACGSGCGFDTTTLPSTGAYTVVLDPSGDLTGSLTLKAYTVPVDASATISTDGTASTLTTTTPGQNGSWTFNGTAGQRVSFSFSGGSYGNGNAGNDWVAVKKADGTTVAGGQACGSGCWFDATTLPATGSYTVVLDPSGSLTGSMTLKAYTVPTDASATVSTDGTASTLTTTIPGQNGSWTFSGAAGQKVSFAFSGGTFGNGNAGNDWVAVKKADGTTVLNGQACGSSCSYGTTTLPATGTYSVVLDPSGSLVGALTVAVTTTP